MIKPFIFLFTELSSQSDFVLPERLHLNFNDIPFYEDYHHNLIRLEGHVHFIQDGPYIVAANIAGDIRPLFNWVGRMILVNTQENNRIENMIDGVANHYHFEFPHILRAVPPQYH